MHQLSKLTIIFIPLLSSHACARSVIPKKISKTNTKIKEDFQSLLSHFKKKKEEA